MTRTVEEARLTLADIAEKADGYADNLGSAEGLKSAMRIVAQNVRDVIAANYRATLLAAPAPSAAPDTGEVMSLPPTCPTCGAFVFSDPNGTAHCGCPRASLGAGGADEGRAT
jgi:hypothetical protein